MAVKTNAHTKRFLRRAAIEKIHAWIRDQRLNNPMAKSVLLALAVYVDGEGTCFPSIDELAKVTELSAATVRRRLDWLEGISVIQRRPRWICQNGERTSDQRGKRTTDEIKLLLDGNADHVRAKLDIDCADEWRAEPDASPSPDAGQNLEADRRALTTAVPQPSHYSDPLISEPEPEESNQGFSSNIRSDDGPSWDMFEAVWLEPIKQPSTAETIWFALTPSDRATAIRAAKAYVARQRAKSKRGVPLSAQTFLREQRAWRQWLVPMSHTELASTSPPVFVAQGSTQWRARCVIADITNKTRPVAIDCPAGRGCVMQPLPVHFLTLSQFADEDPKRWMFIPAGEAHCDAWCDVLGIEPHLITLGVRSRYLNGRSIPDWPIKEKGLRVPCFWPPDRPIPEPS